ncbi:MAG: fibronectin type III domain-containing protein [Kineosporiaceae bacterium]|nr:fibronectin type III domain-containing protein [Kineosporiaceae bacterium]
MILVVLGTALSPVTTADPADAAPVASRSVWVWEHGSDPAELYDWTVDHDVDIVNLVGRTTAPSPAELTYLAALGTALHAAGKRLNALAGDTGDWAIASNGKAVAWARAHLATGAFDGVQLDVEPWANEAIWGTSAPDGSPATAADAALRQATLRSYVQMIADVKAAVGQGKRVEVSTGSWFNYYTLGDGRNVLEAVMDAADSIAVMSYNTDTAVVERIVAQELAYGNVVGKTVRVGMETNRRPDSPEETYYGRSRAILDADAATLVSHLGSNPAFGGIIIEDLSGWMALPTGPAAPSAVTATPTGTGTVAVTWHAPNGGSAPAGYRLCWTGTTAGCVQRAGSSTSATVTGLDASNSAYRFTVTAIGADGAGPPSALSNTVGTPTFAVTNTRGAPTHPTPGFANLDASVTGVRSNGGGALLGVRWAGSSPAGCRPPRGPVALTGRTRITCTVAPRGSRYRLGLTLTNVFGTSAPTYATHAVAAASRPGRPVFTAVTGRGRGRTITVIIRGAAGYGSAVTQYVETSRCSRHNPTTAGTYTYTCPAGGRWYSFTVTARNAHGAGPTASVRTVRSHR